MHYTTHTVMLKLIKFKLILITSYRDTMKGKGGRTPRQLMLEMMIAKKLELEEAMKKMNTFREDERENETNRGGEEEIPNTLRTAQFIGECTRMLIAQPNLNLN